MFYITFERLVLMNYKFPNPKDILNVSNQSDNDNEDIKQHQLQIINRVLLNHNISCECNNIIDAANVFLYDFEIFNFGISFNKIKALEKSLQMFLQSNDITINFSQANVGFTISVPKQKRQLITTGDCLINMQSHFNTMIVPLGLDEYNNPVYIDIAKMPHLLVAGTTGSGKSVCINNIITSLLFNAQPYSLQFIMIDPKQVELVNYNNLKGFMPTPTITDVYKAATVLYNVTYKMDNIYRLIQSKNCRNIDEYNAISNEKIPKTIIVIDELADLMIRNKKEIEPLLVRIAQLGRACGIHLILATQRPSREVITGLIKVNIPARICFKVPSAINSRVTLDTSGAEKLLGNGDGLFQNSDGSPLVRFQSAFITTEEIERTINYINSEVGHSC